MAALTQVRPVDGTVTATVPFSVPRAVARSHRARMTAVAAEPTLSALVLDDLLTAVADRLDVAVGDERARLRLGRSWLEKHLADELAR